MVLIKVKPISVNEAWKGRRFKTDDYKAFERKMMYLLPKSFQLPPPPYEIHYKWGFSNSASDFDNPVKPMTDILQKKYKFNDKLIMKAVIEKTIVGKGQEFIEFEILHYEK
jgi:Holliday junction resolvase RusA-like endonuclease